MYRMKSSENRHRLVAALMISSQILLTAFVIYWLLGQYRAESGLLQDQLSSDYQEVHDQLVDTMLMKNLVLPSLDMTQVQVSMHDSCLGEMPTDSVPHVLMAQQFFARVPEGQEIIDIQMEGSVQLDSGSQSINVSSMITDEERMVRSVKLFINSNQEAFQTDTGLQVFAMKLDSSALLLNLEKTMVEKDLTFTLQWPEEAPDKTKAHEIRGIFLDGGQNRFLPVLQVKHYGSYLFRSILPQLLFAIILLILSASALIFAYRSLLRQLALNMLREDFIGNVSHELKTPVSTIKVALEALRSFDLQKDPAKSDEYLEMASSELERLERLVGKVLHHELLNNPALVLEKEPCDLGKLARKVVHSLDLPIREAGAKVSVQEEGPAHMLEVDPVYVAGIIMNLIDNGLKYTGEHPQIQVVIAYNISGTSLSVSDKGPGIPDEYRDQVFEKFFRIPSGLKHDVKGYGLGLNFAKQVMAQHGGKIFYKNLPEGGCRFTLLFPPTKT